MFPFRTVLVPLVLGAALVVTLAPSVPAAAAGSVDETGWIALDEIGGEDTFLYDAWATGDQSWHVGGRLVLRLGEYRSIGYVEHCIRDACTQTFPEALDPVFPADARVRLLGVSGTTPEDVWVVGYADEAALAAHWDGSAWTAYQPGAAGVLEDVSAVSTTEVVVVGRAGVRPTVRRWDGDQWHSLPTKVGGCALDRTAFTAVAAAGRQPLALATCGFGGPQAYELRGDHWRPARLPAAAEADTFHDVAADEQSGWIVGRSPDGSASILRCVGRNWAVEPVPADGRLTGVATTPSGIAWAVGATGEDEDDRLAVRWNGRKWRLVDSAGLAGTFDSVAVLADGTAYASGNRTVQPFTNFAFVARHD